MQKLTVKKGEIIQRKGDYIHKVYHVQAGLLRSYCLDHNGKENIFMFGPEGWTIADSTPPDQPAVLFIDALEDSVVHVLDKDLKREEKNVGKILKRMAALQQRVIMLLSSSAIERYEFFITTYPDMVKRVPQKMIASYLGVTPETLSTVKRQWLKQLKERDSK